MPRMYAGWRTTFKDVQEINSLLGRAETLVNKAFTSLTEDAGLPQDIASGLLPELEWYDTATVDMLHDSFSTRADFEREKSRLKRIIAAGEGKPRRDVVSITPDNANQLTSFFIDDNGEIIGSQWERKELNLITRMENQRRVKRLEEQGVRMQRLELFDAEGKPMYDLDRHRMTVLVPETPSQMQKYRDIISTHPDRAVMNVNVPDNAVVELWGDDVPIKSLSRHKMTTKAMARSVEVDRRAAESLGAYFDNYKTIIDTTMPTRISDELDKYIDRIGELPPQEQARIYDHISDVGSEVGTIEYLYYDSALGLPAKMLTIINFWRSEIAPELGVKEWQNQPKAEAPMIDEALEEFGYSEGGFYPIFAEFNRRRTDEPTKGWAKDIYYQTHERTDDAKKAKRKRRRRKKSDGAQGKRKGFFGRGRKGKNG